VSRKAFGRGRWRWSGRSGISAVLSARGTNCQFLISLPFFWIRFLDAFSRGRAVADAASGFFFLGRRSDQMIDPHSMTEYYGRQK
jgi:hypothetical protein